MAQNLTDLNNDSELIKEIKKNNNEAFKTLFYKYYEKLIKFCFYRIKNLDIARDLVNELFMKVWSSRDKLNPEKSIQAYLYRSLINEIINYKKHSSSKLVSLEGINEISTNSEEYTIEKNIDIENAINALPNKLKSVFLLSRIEGFKYYEIAEICDISIKAVEKRMSKAFKILRKLID